MNIINAIKAWSRHEWIYYYYSKFRSGVQRYLDDTFESTKIVDNLWLGAISSSCNKEALHQYGIEMVISAVLGGKAQYPFDFNYERSKLRDTEDENIIKEFERLLPIIHTEIINKRGVLVHCYYGRSRSASIVAAYLIFYHHMTTDEALDFIRSKRSQIDPNPGYIQQLRQFEEQVKYKQKSE
jgi:dual specificity phosphatase 12